VYCLLVFIDVFNILRQEQLRTIYFIHVIHKATIALFSLASCEVKHGLII